MFYNSCPYCGANLDPGEKCDCLEEKTSEAEYKKTIKKVVFSPSKERIQQSLI